MENHQKIGPSKYQLPTYSLPEQGKGLQMTVHMIEIPFIKGGGNPQSGIITEDLLSMLVEHLEEMNVGDLKNHQTSMAIENLEKAKKWIEDRKVDRRERGVYGTNKT